MRMFMVVLALLAACKGGPKERDETKEAAGPEALVNAAIDAAGGMAALESVRGYHIETAGEWMGQAYQGVVHFRAPHDWRWQMTSAAMNMSVWVLGPQMDCYAAMGGPAVRASAAQRPNYVGHMQVSNAAMLPNLLLVPGVTLEGAPAVVIDGTECPALVASFEGCDPATFVFDPTTKLIRRFTFLMSDESSGQKIPGQVDLFDWQDVGGVTLAHKNTMTMGAESMSETVKSVAWNPEIPAGVLEAPEVMQVAVHVRDVPETRVAVHHFEGPWDQIGTGIQKTMTWITENGGRITGPVSLIYRSPTEMVTGIQIPVEMPFRQALATGDVRLMRQPAFRFAYAVHQGKVHECYVLFDPVFAALPGLGCTKSGPVRVIYMTPPDAEMNCTAQVGVPVRGGEVTETAEEPAEMEEPEDEGEEEGMDEPGDEEGEEEGDEEEEGGGGEQGE